MIVLFIHQNFPGQYKHLVRHFLETRKARVLFITQANKNVMEGVEKVIYDVQHPPSVNCHPLSIDFDRAVRVGAAAAAACRDLKARGLTPDIILGHNGWGEMLFVKDIFPETPILSYFEFYYHPENVDVGFDSEFAGDVDAFRLRTRNAVNLLGFDVADWGHTPTLWQRHLHPPELRSRITVLHEGIDTEICKPDPEAWLYLDRDNLLLNRDLEIVTYVARNLEPYRGFHVFMRAAALILKRRPKAHIVIVGGDEVSYGSPPVGGLNYRETMLQELASTLDLNRLHFLGRVSYENYLRLLQISSVHVYLTYPFVLSWSFIEALACGCAMVGSDTPPVVEVLKDGQNGVLADFFSPIEIAERVDEVLDMPERTRALRQAARKTAVERFDLKTRLLPLWDRLVDDMLEGRRPSLNLND